MLFSKGSLSHKRPGPENIDDMHLDSVGRYSRKTPDETKHPARNMIRVFVLLTGRESHILEASFTVRLEASKYISIPYLVQS